MRIIPYVLLMFLFVKFIAINFSQHHVVVSHEKKEEIQPITLPNQSDEFKKKLPTTKINGKTLSYTYLTNAISKLELIVEARCVFLYVQVFKSLMPVESVKFSTYNNIISLNEIHIMLSHPGPDAIEYFENVLKNEQSQASHYMKGVYTFTPTYESILQNYLSDKEKLEFVIINSHFRSLLLGEVCSALFKNVDILHADTVKLLP